MENIKRNLKKRLADIWNEPRIVFPIFGFAFTSLAGTLLHFLPDIIKSDLIYLIAPTNESIFEHLKLLFYPYLLFTAVEYAAYGKDVRGFMGAKLRGVLLGEAFIVGAHYIYSGILGRRISAIDISLFFIAAAIAYIVPCLLLRRASSARYSAATAVAAFILIIAFFTVFTFLPLHIGIFADPMTGTYGITGQ